jgi:hypothetical protein
MFDEETRKLGCRNTIIEEEGQLRARNGDVKVIF